MGKAPNGPGQCKFFTGVHNDLCSRGVKYSQFLPKLPCIQFIPISARGGTYLRPGEEPAEIRPFGNSAPPKTCPFYAENTPEEEEKEREESEAAITQLTQVLLVISDWKVLPRPAKDRSEIVECPICQGKLHLGQSSHKGHVHAVCETAGCVHIME